MTETHPEAPHDTSTRFYWLVGAALAVITIVEVAVSLNGVIVSHENPDFTSQIILLAILLVLSVIKGGAVVMFFMHLRGDARIFQFLFIAPFLMAVSMLLAFLAINSGHVGIGG
jgi:cytochrome c oxidase subunit 4/cytochrome o ubiquinol oxidase operon protein cyoD